MTNATATIVINTTKEAAEAIRNEINAQPGSQSYITERKNLAGGPEWLLVGQLIVQALSPILVFMQGYLAEKEKKKEKSGVSIKISSPGIGDIEIKNATSPDELQRYLSQVVAMIHSASKPENTDD